MQFAQTEILGIVDDNRVGVRHIYTRLDDGCGDQHVIFVVSKTQDSLFQFFGIHLPVSDDGAYTRGEFAYQPFEFVELLYTVVYDENLSSPAQFEIDGLAYDVFVEGVYFGLYRIAVGRRGRDGREVACSHE